MDKIRLDRFICNQTQISRSEIKLILKNGLVTLNGNVEKNGEIRILPDESTITVRGKTLSQSRFRYLIMNKPQGVVCATQDKINPTVISIIPKELLCTGLAPAGRLDKDTEGLLLITNDGDFAHKVISPRSHVPKYYIAKLEKPYEDFYKEAFARGIEYTGEKFMSAKVCPIDSSGRYVLVEICEGKFHQVKKMFAAVSNRVLYLRREQIGKLILPQDLVPGGTLDILHKEALEMLNNESFETVRQRIFVNFSSI